MTWEDVPEIIDVGMHLRPPARIRTWREISALRKITNFQNDGQTRNARVYIVLNENTLAVPSHETAVIAKVDTGRLLALLSPMQRRAVEARYLGTEDYGAGTQRVHCQRGLKKLKKLVA